MLNITKEKVLEAAAKCPQAKETLKTLFPEVFEQAPTKLRFSDVTFKESGMNEGFVVLTGENVLLKTFYHSRIGGDLNYTAIVLGDKFNWERKTVDGNDTLIPTRK